MPANDDWDDSVHDAVRVEYRDMAPWYDRFWRSYTEGTLRRPLGAVLRELDALVGRGAKGISIVDVGCGTGALVRRLLDARPVSTSGGGGVSDGGESPYEAICVEPSPEMLEQAQGKFDKQEGQLVTFLNSPAEHLPLEDESVDVVVTTSAFHFFSDREQSLKEMRRVLRQGGTLVIADWCADYWIVKLYHFFFERLRWNWRFEKRYPSPLSGAGMKGLVEGAGFTEINLERYRVRVFYIFFWGMQTIVAKKS